MRREKNTSEWLKVTLSASECATKGRILQNDFENLFNINGAPKGVALFASKNFEQQFFYFSPGAVAIARGLIQHFGGTPSLPPTEDEYAPFLLVGHPDAAKLLSERTDTTKSRPKRILDKFLRRD
jgi:hypothetical protein